MKMHTELNQINIRDTAKAVLRGKLTALNTHYQNRKKKKKT